MVGLLRKLDAGLIGILNVVVIVTSLAITGLILFLVLARFVLGWSVVGVSGMVGLPRSDTRWCGSRPRCRRLRGEGRAAVGPRDVGSPSGRRARF